MVPVPVSMSLIPSGELKASSGVDNLVTNNDVSMSLIPSGELKVVGCYLPQLVLYRINESNSLRGVERKVRALSG